MIFFFRCIESYLKFIVVIKVKNYFLLLFYFNYK